MIDSSSNNTNLQPLMESESLTLSAAREIVLVRAHSFPNMTKPLFMHEQVLRVRSKAEVIANDLRTIPPVSGLRSPHVDGGVSRDKAGSTETSGRNGSGSLRDHQQALESKCAL